MRPSEFELPARAFVWSVWLFMLLVALTFLVQDGRNLPQNEDWQLVAALTGNEPDLIGSLVADNNEYVPLTRMILLVLLEATGGDFRSGMLLQILMLGGLSLALILVMRHLREGSTRFADAMFPIALLHLGHAENLLQNWQLTQVLPTILVCVLLVTFLAERALAAPAAEYLCGSVLMLLPLCGMNGVGWVPMLAPLLIYRGVVGWRSEESSPKQRRVFAFLIVAGAVAIGLASLYFIQYVRPFGMPTSPGPGESIRRTLQFLSMGLGPAVRRSWFLAIPVAILMPVSSWYLITVGALRDTGRQRPRTLTAIVFLASLTLFFAGVGWVRSRVVVSIYDSWPATYSLQAVPALLACFIIWEIYGSPRYRKTVQNVLFGIMVLLLPFNTLHGLRWLDSGRAPHEAFLWDLAAGTPFPILARTHRGLLNPSVESGSIAGQMELLRDAGIGPFDGVDLGDPAGAEPLTETEPPPNQDAAAAPSSVVGNAATDEVNVEVRYRDSGAGEVFLVWGLNGYVWDAFPADERSSGTSLDDSLMLTPMRRGPVGFVARLRVPDRATIHYGFSITRGEDGTMLRDWTGESRSAWETGPDYVAMASDESIISVRAALYFEEGNSDTPVLRVDGPLEMREIRYRQPRASRVDLSWGVGEWHALPEEFRLPSTLVDGRMRIPMIDENGEFVARVPVPPDAAVDYAFFILDERGGVTLQQPIWEGRSGFHTFDHGVIRVTSGAVFPDDLLEILNGPLFSIRVVSKLLLVWLTSWLAIWWLLALFPRRDSGRAASTRLP